MPRRKVSKQVVIPAYKVGQEYNFAGEPWSIIEVGVKGILIERKVKGSSRYAYLPYERQS